MIPTHGRREAWSYGKADRRSSHRNFIIPCMLVGDDTSIVRSEEEGRWHDYLFEAIQMMAWRAVWLRHAWRPAGGRDACDFVRNITVLSAGGWGSQSALQ